MTGTSNSGIIEPFTPFPNALIDCVMPTLKDTEWRLLCVIVRQTIGWSQKGGRRKSRDWLTQWQLMARTGRNSAALSAALDVLVRKRLVDAWDEAGEPLLTPQERRRNQGRIYFGLCQETLQRLTDEDSKTPLRKANTTKETEDKRNINNGSSKNFSTSVPQSRQQTLPLHTGWTRADEVAASRHLNTRSNNPHNVL